MKLLIHDSEEMVKTIEMVQNIVRGVKPLLAGHSPAVQSAALADLLSMWLAAHPDFMREDLLQGYVELTRKLIPLTEKELFSGRGHPNNTGGN